MEQTFCPQDTAAKYRSDLFCCSVPPGQKKNKFLVAEQIFIQFHNVPPSATIFWDNFSFLKTFEVHIFAHSLASSY